MNHNSELLLLLIVLFLLNTCKSQQATIYRGDNDKFGLMSSSGKMILDTQFLRITPYYDLEKGIYEAPGNRIPKGPFPYFIVKNAAEELAIADLSGKIIFDFIEARNLEIDTASNTVAAVHRLPTHGTVSKLYTLDGKLVDTTGYKNIGYFDDNELIILQESRDTIYLFNVDNNQKYGPFDHFNWWPDVQWMSVRHDDKWGLIEVSGEELIPIIYSSIRRVTPEYLAHPYHRLAEKPEGVKFIFTAVYEDESSRKTVIFDENLKAYQYLEGGVGEKRQLVPTGG